VSKEGWKEKETGVQTKKLAHCHRRGYERERESEREATDTDTDIDSLIHA